jgi:N-acetylglutamate synthase-like GNAT family acetyltransferase
MMSSSRIKKKFHPTAVVGGGMAARSKDAKALIRKADSDDISILSHLIRTAYGTVAERFNLTPGNCPKHPSNCNDGWIKNDFKRGVVYFILEHDDRPIGCTALEKADPGHCYLERLAVAPPYRNNGLGKKLVQHVLAEAKALNMKRVGIGIIAEQTELKSWYRKIGFVEKETKQFPHLPFRVAFMTYTLSGDTDKSG